MTTFTAVTSADMTDWDLGDIAHGLNIVHTLTSWNVTGAGALCDYHFTGHDLSYTSGLNPKLVGGTIDSLSVSEFGATTYTVQGSIAALDVAKYIAHDNAAALQRAWFAGNDTFNGSAFSDHLLGYNGNDTFNLANGGSDIVEGGYDDDTFVMGAAMGATDEIDGGRGADTLALDGGYWLSFSPDMLKNVETVRLAAGNDYILHFTAANVGHGGLTVDASALGNGHAVEANMDSGSRGFTVTGGTFDDTMRGAGGRDHFAGNAGNDVLVGRGGADLLLGGVGADVFVYSAVSDSTSFGFDTIGDFDSAADKISLESAVTGVDAALTHGTLSLPGFNAALALQVNGAVLGAHHAVLFTPNTGGLAGQTFLVIDGNGVAGYQGGKDYLLHLSDTSHLGSLGVDDFLLNG